MVNLMKYSMKTVLLSLLCLTVATHSALGDPARLQAIRAEAEKGDAKAQNKLGVYYQLGLSVEPSDVEAVKWFLLAADQGDGEAQFNLGEMFETGRGVTKDRRTALIWYRKSCDSGCKCGCRSYRKLFRELEAELNP
jgi:hypothetical protein